MHQQLLQNCLNQYTISIVQNLLHKTFTIQKLFQKQQLFQFQVEDHFYGTIS